MTGRERRILVLEDDEDIASALSRGLEREGYRPAVAHDLDVARSLAAAGPFDAAIIDVMLGAEDGKDMVRGLRAAGMRAPIVMLSALSGVAARTAGLEAGADDYVAKPFDFAELIARIQVQERRRTAQGAAQFAGLAYDATQRLVRGPTRAVRLTEREGLLFELFLAHPEEVLSRGAIFDALWAAIGGASENVVDVYIGYLRRKLAPMSDFGAELRTVRGRGFILTKSEGGEPAHEPA